MSTAVAVAAAATPHPPVPAILYSLMEYSRYYYHTLHTAAAVAVVVAAEVVVAPASPSHEAPSNVEYTESETPPAEEEGQEEGALDTPPRPPLAYS